MTSKIFCFYWQSIINSESFDAKLNIVMCVSKGQYSFVYEPVFYRFPVAIANNFKGRCVQINILKKEGGWQYETVPFSYFIHNMLSKYALLITTAFGFLIVNFCCVPMRNGQNCNFLCGRPFIIFFI